MMSIDSDKKLDGTASNGDTRMQQRPALEVGGLCMRYGTTDVLKGLDLRVEQGEILALLGPNGAGKTTTIEILEGFRRRSAGQVEVLGVDPEVGDERWRARLGIVLQSWTDHRRWRVRDLLHHIGQYYRPYGSAGRDRPYAADALLGRVGLSDQGSTVVSKLSGGQRRRLDVAIGLIGNPELLFLDEPTVGFDPEARYEFHALIDEIARTDGTTIILTTHDLREAEKLAHRIAILMDGQIVAEGSASDLSARFSVSSSIRYTLNDVSQIMLVNDTTLAVKELLRCHDTAVRDLEIRPTSLEDTYLKMVREFEGHTNRKVEDGER